MLRSKDLRRNPIAVFNSILSARLISILDFIFADTALTETVCMARRLLAHNRSRRDPSSRSRILEFAANVRRHAPTKNLNSPAFDKE